MNFNIQKYYFLRPSLYKIRPFHPKGRCICETYSKTLAWHFLIVIQDTLLMGRLITIFNDQNREPPYNTFNKASWKSIIHTNYIVYILHTVGELKDWTLHRACVVKLPKLRAVLARQEWILTFVKRGTFFLKVHFF